MMPNELSASVFCFLIPYFSFFWRVYSDQPDRNILSILFNDKRVTIDTALNSRSFDYRSGIIDTISRSKQITD
jgi:hypothetical protein